MIKNETKFGQNLANLNNDKIQYLNIGKLN